MNLEYKAINDGKLSYIFIYILYCGGWQLTISIIFLRHRKLLRLITILLSSLFILISISSCDDSRSEKSTPVLGDELDEEPSILSAWIVLGPSGSIIARAITQETDCPMISITTGSSSADTSSREMSQTMDVRQDASNSDFPVLVCQSMIQADASSVSIGSVNLPLPVENPTRIAIIGDTGCRLESSDEKYQDCNDPSKWPFNTIAQSAASWGPDLIIHVGDYIYREDPCPSGKSGCEGSPYGDNWDTWNADFFTPAEPLLDKAPWIMARGNHEMCGRAGQGWFIFLDATLDAPPSTDLCADFSTPFSIDIGEVTIFNMDTACAEDSDAPSDLVDQYASEFQRFASVNADSAWLLTHHPMWGIDDEKKSSSDPKCCTNLTLQTAAQMNFPDSVNLVLSGHIHLFQYLNFNKSGESGTPSQLITGASGVELNSSSTGSIKDMEVAGMKIGEGETIDEFGFSTIEYKSDGTVEVALRDTSGNKILECDLDGDNLSCN